jgi:hypothetical protein
MHLESALTTMVEMKARTMLFPIKFGDLAATPVELFLSHNTMEIQPRIQAMNDRRLRARFDYTLEDMGLSISINNVTVRCHFRSGEEYPRMMSTQSPNRQL